jgi:hypothetical protein
LPLDGFGDKPGQDALDLPIDDLAFEVEVLVPARRA